MDNMESWQTALLLGLAFGAIYGIWVAGKSAKRQPIKGGAVTKAFHYAGAVCMASALPTILIGGLVYRLPFVQTFGMAFGLIALCYVMLVIHTVVAPAQ
jgi:hypothetical protein